MDDWDKERYKEAEIEFEKYFKNDKIYSMKDLDDIIVNLMIEYGPDSHCDGHQIMALIIWRLMKNDPTAKPDYGKSLQ
jgi:hypothetical protein